MDPRRKFYTEFVSRNIPNRSATILVVGGGDLDKTVLASLGFANVTISNLDDRMDATLYEPFDWRFEDAQNLTCEDGSFDYVLTHQAIHHANLPHKMVAEMYRVAVKGIIAFEPTDSFVTRLAARLGVSERYETLAVYDEGGASGGVNNTCIPNFVYRWTENEVKKTISAFAPHVVHKTKFEYKGTFPCLSEYESDKQLKYLVLRMLQPAYWLLSKVYPKQLNIMAFYVEKPEEDAACQPWLNKASGELTFDMDWGRRRYS